MKHDKPAIGLWFAPCCELDVQQIEDQEQLDGLEVFDDDDDGFPELISWGFYDTRDELLAALAE